MSARLKVLLVAIPLMARSGVYKTTHDLVEAARAQDLDWTGVVGVRPEASGMPIITAGVDELIFNEHGTSSLSSIRKLLASNEKFRAADVVISLISQTDIALSSRSFIGKRLWVAWVRGRPWPAPHEQNSVRTHTLRLLESRALRRAADVWATTPVLAEEFASVRPAHIVPAGIPLRPSAASLSNPNGPIVWAGRVDVDKRPGLFLSAVNKLGHQAVLYGDGPLLRGLKETSPPNVRWAGWSDEKCLWQGASIFVGTSSREAFGRSAVEAAASGLPVILGDKYGAAPLLFTDTEIASHCCVSSADPNVWSERMRSILNDSSLRHRISEHVSANARKLTIDGSVAAARARLKVLTDD